MKRIIVIVTVFILLINNVYSFSENTGDIPSIDDFSGGSIGDDGDIPTASLNPVTSDLNIKLMITCEDSTRGTAEWVFYQRGEFHDDPGVESPDGDYQEMFESVFISDWSTEPNILMEALKITETNPDNINPSAVRYEGKCYAWVKMDHQRFDDTISKERHGYNNNPYGTWYQVPTSQFYYEVDWDSNGVYCQALGGAWLEKTGDIGDEYDGMQCCGDDWTWIHNYPLDYKHRTISEIVNLEDNLELCLYWDIELGYGLQAIYPNSKIDDDDLYGFGDNSYMCTTPANIGGSNGNHFAYDPILGYDDMPEELTYNSKENSYYFLDSGDIETDLGFYSPSYIGGSGVVDIFDDDVYLQNKLNQLNDNGNTNEGIPWTIETLEAEIILRLGSLENHYQLYGINEGIVPYAGFDENIYFQNKVDQLVLDGAVVDGIGPDWTVTLLKDYFTSIDLTVIEHYEYWGRDEGISPYEDTHGELIINENNPAFNPDARFCDLDLDNWVAGVSGSSKFEWLTIEEAANKNQLICELYLGFNWTGSKCCGAPGESFTYDDTQKECNARNVASGLISSTQGPLSRLTYQKEFEEDCDINKNRQGIEYSNNRACYQSVAIDNQTIVSYSPIKPEIKNVYNENGELFVCENEDYPVLGYDEVPKCTLKGEKDKFALCTYTDDSWVSNNEAVLIHGWSGAVSFQEIEDEITKSSVPQEIIDLSLVTDENKTECCMSDSCWDGQECVPTKTDYYTDNVFWDLFNQNIEYDESMSIYKCNNGTWSDPLFPQYDWDYNTENPKFCIEDYQCSCTTCDSNVDTDGCTTIPYYFENDNLCIEREWTSRTKVLATTLMEMGGDDYVLHCDDNSNSINNYISLEMNFENDLNSVCVLSNSGETNTLGFSFKSLDFDATDVETNTIIVDFIQTVFDDDNFETCNSAITTSTDFDTYISCDSSNKYWFNNKLKILLYNQDGLSSVSMANYETHNTVLETNFGKISNYIEDYNSEIQGIGDVNAFKNAFDFNRLYIYKNSGSIKILGLIEILHDASRSVDPKNRKFMGLWYDKSIIDNCYVFDLAYQDVEPGAFCSLDANNDIIVLNKNLVTNTFPYWLDLTAKLRFE